MRRQFKYDIKESYSAEELEKIIEQNSKFVENGFKDYVSQEDLNKIKDELKPYKAEERFKKITSLLPENSNKELSKDIIRLSSISDDMTEDQIKTELSKTVNERDYFKITIEDSKPLKIKDGNKDKKYYEDISSKTLIKEKIIENL